MDGLCLPGLGLLHRLLTMDGLCLPGLGLLRPGFLRMGLRRLGLRRLGLLRLGDLGLGGLGLLRRICLLLELRAGLAVLLPQRRAFAVLVRFLGLIHRFRVFRRFRVLRRCSGVLVALAIGRLSILVHV